MTQPASVGLKYGFLIVLYLFLVWVAFSALRDLRRGRGEARLAEYEPSADATGMYDAVSGPLDASGFEPGCWLSAPPAMRAGSPTICQSR